MSENLEILQKQEELLQFPEFNHKTAWELGSFMVSYAQKHNITIAVSPALSGWNQPAESEMDGKKIQYCKTYGTQFSYVRACL